MRDEDGDLHAVNNVCSHQYILLSEGEVDGCTIECWLHGSRFDLRTGQPSGLPATVPIDVYPLTVEGDDVLVDVTAPLTTTSTRPAQGELRTHGHPRDPATCTSASPPRATPPRRSCAAST